MTRVFITIDTEYSAGLVGDASQAARADNFARSIACSGEAGDAGIPHVLRRLKATGQSAVFFVDPMPALVWGVGAIEDIVAPILEAGHDVQLHLHTEWLQWAGENHPLTSKRQGANLYEFPFEEQCALIDYARAQLMAAGAPSPIAFRAGNYGANDDTLKALADLGIAYDTSHCPAMAGTASRLSLGAQNLDPVEHCGVIEVPVASIKAIRTPQRHGQITALSLAEMRAAILHARAQGRGTLTLVSHSFELFSRNRRKVKTLVRDRFDRLCGFLAETPGVTTGTYRDHPPNVAAASAQASLLPVSPFRTGARIAEQALANALYGS